MKLQQLTGTSLFLAALALSLTACGGGDKSSSGDKTQFSVQENAFAQTVYPIVRTRCVICHDENTTQQNAPKFAHESVTAALAVTEARNLINLNNPVDSEFVLRLALDKHHCWTSCNENSSEMAGAISQWSKLLAINPPDTTGTGTGTGTGTSTGTGTGNAGDISVQAFSNSLHPLMTQYCANCHDGTLAITAFANSDPKFAHDITLNRNLVNLQNPVASKLVTYLDNQHNCWSDCTVNADKTLDAIIEWQSLLTNSNDTTSGIPIAVNDTFTTPRNTPLLTGNVLFNDSDAEGDTLGIISFDSRSLNGGNVSNNLNGTFTYTPANGFVGLDTFAYTISDEQGNSARAIVAISVTVVSGPQAVDDLIKTNQNTPLTITTLLQNDISSSNSPLTIVFVETSTRNRGVVTLGANNQVTYTPPSGFTGSDYFAYTISDGQATSKGQVEIDINANPTAVSDAVYTYINVSANTGSVLENDRDLNGDPLTVTSFDISSAQGGGVIYNGDGSFTYSPPNNFSGNDSFEYIVFDGRGGASSATVFVTVTNKILRDDNRFLSFLNQSSPLHAEDANSARAYYRAVDPLDQRTTLEAWRELNGYNIGADAFAVYINNNDLGFSRRMFVRTDPITGIVSSYVENFANLRDAQNRINLIATVAMEFTVAPGQDPLNPEAKRFTTFYVFKGNGLRDLGADLDGRGFKFLPGLCTTCHGGRPKALVGGIYPDNGDTNAKFIPWDINTYLFSDATASVSRSAQEGQFKIFNQTVLSTNPNAAQREIIEGWYGGPNLLANTFNGGFVPKGWLAPAAPAEATQIYLQVVGPFCRACHIVQGNAFQSDIDFSTYEKFISHKDDIERLTFDEGTMPMALRTWDRFWENPFIPETLASFLDSSKLLEVGELLTPGRPIANAGPFREAALGRVILNGNGSVFTGGSSNFIWTLVSRPANSIATIQNANQADAFIIADTPGDYIAQLIVNDGISLTPASPPAEVVIRVSGTILATSFVSHVSPLFNECAVCHLGFNNPKFNNLRTLYDNVINFVDLNDPIHSRILTKPSGEHHAGGTIKGFETQVSEKYKIILQWILEGAPDN